MNNENEKNKQEEPVVEKKELTPQELIDNLRQQFPHLNIRLGTKDDPEANKTFVTFFPRSKKSDNHTPAQAKKLPQEDRISPLEGKYADILQAIIQEYPMPVQNVQARDLISGPKAIVKGKDEEYVERCPHCGSVLFKRRKDDYLSAREFKPCKDVICKVDSAYLDDSSYYYEPFDILADIWNLVLTMPDGTHYLYYCLKQLMEADVEDEVEQFLVEEFMEKMGVKVIGGETDSDMMGGSGRFVALTVHRDLQDGLLKRLQVMQKRLEAFKKAKAKETKQRGE
ncbi:MAG TPA: hypothetical protein PLV50_06090 [Smithella sp.]|nr:hypothetical protein [Smithella sp.]HOG90086.1 hypothetical protein [Smithella sp.]